MQGESDDVDRTLGQLRARLDETLARSLLGLYLYGSAATGSFTPGVSDIDLLAVMADDVTGELFDSLREMHEAFATRNPHWDDRIEVQYVSAAALREFRSRPSRIAVISPGEPLCYKQAGIDWALNWYDVQENGITLAGPPPSTFIPHITIEEFVESVAQYAAWRTDRIADHRGAETYAMLTMCRALWTAETGKTTSKEAAAAWAATRFPEWAAVIEAAVACRQSPELSRRRGDGASRDATLHFTRFVRGEVARRTVDRR